MSNLKQARFRDTPGVTQKNYTNVSSSIFYYPDDGHVDTTVSFLNYWKLKRDIDVELVATTRGMDGEVVLREALSFDGRDVINYRPQIDGPMAGSVEVVASSDQNLVVPYAALMVVYETERGIGAVHSYARSYTDREIEAGDVHTAGNEGSWTIRDSDTIRGFCVFHNGPRLQPKQQVALTVVNEQGETRQASISCEAIEPHGSVKLYAREHIDDLVGFLRRGVGSASVKFSVRDAFPRLLIGNESIDGGDMQVSHSNFNFNVNPSDYLEEGSEVACKYYPGQLGEGREILVYPHIVPGRYSARHGDRKYTLSDGTLTRIPMNEGPRVVDFERLDGDMPTRLQLGLIVQSNPDVLPAECAFSALTSLEPPKRFHWGVCASDDARRTRLVVMDMERLHGGMPDDGLIELTLYGSSGRPRVKASFTKEDLADLSNGIDLDDISADASSLFDGDFGYYVVFSEYRGLICYSMIEKESGSIVLEHSF